MGLRYLLLVVLFMWALMSCSTLIQKWDVSPKNEINFDNHSIFERIDNYILSAQMQVLKIEKGNSNKCIRGQLGIAQSILDQARQEQKFEMGKDAFISLVEFDRQMRKIRCISKFVESNFGCEISNRRTVLKRWYLEDGFGYCGIQGADFDVINNENAIITEVLYEFDQHTIKPIYYPMLDKLIELSTHSSFSKIHIVGHSDSFGSEAYNMLLSQRRAQSVAKYFIDGGIDASHLILDEKGEAHLREKESEEVSRVFNRFTSIVVFLNKSS